MKKRVETPCNSHNWPVNSRPRPSRRRLNMRTGTSMITARKTLIRFLSIVAALAFAATSLFAQAPPTPEQAPASTYQPKFPGDPARSDSEAAALAYMRVVIRAQRQFNKQYDHFATSLAELVHSGTFTKRMVDPDRGDYTVSFEGKKDSFILTMMPKQLDATHRSFYAEDDGKIRADDEKPADDKSPVVK